MSLENVRSFYERLANDEFFRTQVESVQSKEECSQIVKAVGYDFTQAEFEEYTGQLLESITDSELQDLDEQQLEAVVGGASGFLFPKGGIEAIVHYGLPPSKILEPVSENTTVRPVYGLPIRSIAIE